MPSDLPLSLLIPQIVLHTPLWVWAILAVLVGVGLTLLRDRVMSRARLVVVPLLLGSLSLAGAMSALGLRAPVLLAWCAGMALAFACNRALRWPRAPRRVGSAYAVAGSAWPLALMLSIFALRYVVNVALVFEPALAAQGLFAWPVALLYGALSGLFAARAWRILTVAGPAPAGSEAVSHREVVAPARVHAA